MSPFVPWTWKRTVKDIAMLLVQLSSESFNHIGSLCFNSNKKVVVGPLYNSAFSRFRTANLKPCRTSAESKLARLAHLMRLVREKKLRWDSRWDASGSEYDPVWAYVVFLEAGDIIQASEEMNAKQPTFLRHGDDHAGQLLFKKDGSIAGVLDWELWVS
jgi:hypothetical protein